MIWGTWEWLGKALQLIWGSDEINDTYDRGITVASNNHVIGQGTILRKLLGQVIISKLEDLGKELAMPKSTTTALSLQ